MQKYTLDPPQFFPENIEIESHGETKIDVSSRFEYGIWDRNSPHYVPGSYVTVAIPFDGDGNLFSYQASTFSSNPPRGRVSESAVLVSFNQLTPDRDQIRQEIESVVGRIEMHLKWIKKDCDEWNGRVQEIAEQNVRDRKQRLLKQANMVRSLRIAYEKMPRRHHDQLSPVSPQISAQLSCRAHRKRRLALNQHCSMSNTILFSQLLIAYRKL